MGGKKDTISSMALSPPADGLLSNKELILKETARGIDWQWLRENVLEVIKVSVFSQGVDERLLTAWPLEKLHEENNTEKNAQLSMYTS